jgi:hypothetical protein
MPVTAPRQAPHRSPARIMRESFTTACRRPTAFRLAGYRPFNGRNRIYDRRTQHVMNDMTTLNSMAVGSALLTTIAITLLLTHSTRMPCTGCQNCCRGTLCSAAA